MNRYKKKLIKGIAVLITACMLLSCAATVMANENPADLAETAVLEQTEQRADETEPVTGEEDAEADADADVDVDGSTEAEESVELAENAEAQSAQEDQDLADDNAVATDEIPDAEENLPEVNEGGGGTTASDEPFTGVSEEMNEAEPGNTQYNNVTVTLGSDQKLTLTVRGMTEESQALFLEQLEDQINISLVNETTLKIELSDLPDAEKYCLWGWYDSQLCWAATAANMLWTSHYAQQAVNPDTEEKFQTVDEVFDYFRSIFLDLTGRPDGALSVFFGGTYPFTDSEGWAQLKEDDVKGLLPEVKNEQTESYDAYDISCDASQIRFLENLSQYSMGVLLRSIDAATQQYTDLAHWLTAVGVIYDDSTEELSARYKAIILADSDNDYAAKNFDPYQVWDYADLERAKMAADAVNSYTVYPMTLTDFGPNYGERWCVPYNNRQDVVLHWIAYLKDTTLPIVPAEEALTEPAEEPDKEEPKAEPVVQPKDAATEEIKEDPAVPQKEESETEPKEEPGKTEVPDAPTTEETSSAVEEAVNPEAQYVPSWTNQPANPTAEERKDNMKYDFAAIKERMVREDLVVYSPTDWIYDKEEDVEATFDIFVRTPSTALQNLLLDEDPLTEYHKDIQVVDQNTGIFLIEISAEIMQELSAEDHLLLLQLTGLEAIEETIHVK